MRTVTDAFKANVVGSGIDVVTVEVLDPANPGQVLLELSVLDGSVTIDRSARVRGRCTVTVEGNDLVPVDLQVTQPGLWVFGATGDTFGAPGDVYGARERDATSGVLAPYGTEIRIRRGVEYADGTTELVGLGIFRLADVNVNDGSEGITMTLSGYDRARQVSRARWTSVYVIASGTNYATAIQALITNRYPTAVFNFMTTTRTTPSMVLGVEDEKDPWADACKMAKALGAELFVDGDGVFVLREEPDTTATDAVWDINDGETGTILSAPRRLSDSPGYNGVIVTGEHPDNAAPIRAEAWDDNPDSPTYRLGAYGKVPRFFTSSYLTDAAMAQDTANRMLNGVLGADEEVTALIVPMPALEGSDVVQVTRTATNLNSVFIIERLMIPLRPEGEMSVTLRRRRSSAAA